MIHLPAKKQIKYALLFFLLLPNVFALNATSSTYDVGGFIIGNSAGNATSTTFDSFAIDHFQATNNGSSATFDVNIGGISTIIATSASCGDGTCASDESCQSCSSDCGTCATNTGGGSAGSASSAAASTTAVSTTSEATSVATQSMTQATATVSLGLSQSVALSVNNEKHTVTVTKLAQNVATLAIQSHLQTVVIKTGEDKFVSVDHDYKPDLRITASKITQDKASITITKLQSPDITIPLTPQAAREPTPEQHELTLEHPSNPLPPARKTIAPTHWNIWASTGLAFLIIITLSLLFLQHKKNTHLPPAPLHHHNLNTPLKPYTFHTPKKTINKKKPR